MSSPTAMMAEEMAPNDAVTGLKHSEETTSTITGGIGTDATILTPKNSSRNDDSGSPERPAAMSSPEPNCAICLGKLENKSFTDSCFHQFCFTCLVEWSKVKAECPLCKQSFKSIVHNVRSIEDYDQYHLQTEHFGGEGGSSGGSSRRFRYRSTLTSERRRERALGRLLRGRHATSSSDTEMLSSSPPRNHPARPSPYTTSEFRRYIYEHELWARSSCRSTRYREAAPNFYASNPAVTHRLVPWLNRELNALRYGHQVAYLLELIMSLIERFHIRSPEFREHIRPYFLDRTNHFVHEFFSFARSPHDMVEYDRLVTYGPASLADLSNRDDFVTNSIVPPQPPSVSDDVVVVYSSEEANRRQELIGLQPVVVTRARIFLDLVTELSAAPSTSAVSPVAGPSGIQNRRRAVKQEVTIEDDDDENDNDSDCMIVDVVKSSNTKIPETIVDVSDDDDDDDIDDDDVVSAPSTAAMPSTSTGTGLLKRRLSSSDDADSDDYAATRSSGSEWTPSEQHLKHEPTGHKRPHKSKHRHHHHHHRHHHRKHKSSKSPRQCGRSTSESSSSEKHKRKHHNRKSKENNEPSNVNQDTTEIVNQVTDYCE